MLMKAGQLHKLTRLTRCFHVRSTSLEMASKWAYDLGVADIKHYQYLDLMFDIDPETQKLVGK